jgi:hypothetical protein
MAPKNFRFSTVTSVYYGILTIREVFYHAWLVKINDDHQNRPLCQPYTSAPSISVRPQCQKTFSSRGAKSEFGSATTLAIICRSSTIALSYWQQSVRSLIHISFIVLQSFSTTWTWPISWEYHAEEDYVPSVSSLCRCPMDSCLGSGNIRSMIGKIFLGLFSTEDKSSPAYPMSYGRQWHALGRWWRSSTIETTVIGLF